MVVYNVRSVYDICVSGIPTEETSLARLLNRRGVRHTWLAQQLGVNKWVVHRVLTGKQSASAEWYEEVAALLGVDVQEIRPEPGEGTAA